MAITKQPLKTKSACKVTFTLSAEEAAHADGVALVGDFNDWDLTATPMKKRKNGDFSVALTFPCGTDVAFRYVADGVRWFNDAQADSYAYCHFAAGDNGILHL